MDQIHLRDHLYRSRLLRETRFLINEAITRIEAYEELESMFPTPGPSTPGPSAPGPSSAPTLMSARASATTAERLRLFRGMTSVRPRSAAAGRSTPMRERSRVATWQHDFVCLASKEQGTPPTSLERARLLRAGLGLKSLTFFEGDDSTAFHRELLAAFPMLREGGGYVPQET